MCDKERAREGQKRVKETEGAERKRDVKRDKGRKRETIIENEE